MALGRYEERDLAAAACAGPDLVEQPRCRLRAVCDDEDPPGWGVSHGQMTAPRGAGRITPIG